MTKGSAWAIRGAGFLGLGMAWICTTILDEPAPLWAGIVAFAAGVISLFAAGYADAQAARAKAEERRE